MKRQILVGFVCIGSLVVNAYQWHIHQSTLKRQAALQNFLNDYLTQDKMAEKGSSERKKDLLKKRIHTLEKEKSQAQYAKLTNQMDLTKKGNSKSANGNNNQDNPFRELFRTPEMQEFIKARQRGFLADTYKDFVNQIGLSPKEREKFLDILAQNQTQFPERNRRWPSNSPTNQLNAETENKMESELQELLGSSRYAQYESYQKTIGQRSAMRQFEQQIALSEAPLQPYQRDQMLQILIEENRNAPFSGIRQRDMMRQFSQWDEATAQQYFESQQKANDRILLRAQTVLNPKQLEQFKEFQNGLLKIQETGLKVFRDRANQQNQQN
ncbi:MAG: hypothetical protein K1X66_07680 [Verrucomicrobiae bacterium]|nr:hypothetical protein [Verrucomicrobiae bacterium]